MRTQDLTGPALDWAVAKCENETVLICGSDIHSIWTNSLDPEKLDYSTDWAQGGPIIEREILELVRCGSSCGNETTVFWEAARGYEEDANHARLIGPTPLTAAMRTYVASKLGNEIDIPKEIA